MKYWVRVARIAMLASIVLVIHVQHQRFIAKVRADSLGALTATDVNDFYSSIGKLDGPESHGGRIILDQEGTNIGFVVQTTPEADRYLGFSGPTNLLLAFDSHETVIGARVLSSRDTRDHVELIQQDRKFLQSLNGMTWSQLRNRTQFDTVSGATLTSLAIIQGVRGRVGSQQESLVFPELPTIEIAHTFFPATRDFARDATETSIWNAFDAEGRLLGRIMRTPPVADKIIGYQGPTEVLVAISPSDYIVGFRVGKSFDNEPYIGYVRDDGPFREVFCEPPRTIAEVASIDLKRDGIEGVSGATMSSMAVARGIVEASKQRVQNQNATKPTLWPTITSLRRTIGVIVCIGLGTAVTLVRFRRSRRTTDLLPDNHRTTDFQSVDPTSLRRRTGSPSYAPTPSHKTATAIRIAILVYLGFVSGDLLSISMLAGWAQNGLPLVNSLSLVILAMAAVAVPLFTKRNVYCANLCPHGIAQQWIKFWQPKRRPVPAWLVRVLHAVRPVLVTVMVLTVMLHWPVELVDLEPFDAYSWRAAGWATVSIATVGLAASFFIPMAYCRYGCVTGALIDYVRRHKRVDEWTAADTLTSCLLAAALTLMCF